MMTNNHRRFLSLFVLSCCAAPQFTLADPLFESNDLLEIELNGPLRALSRDREEEPELRPATLSYPDAQGNRQTLTVQLEPRGKSRRDREVCTFPPLWVHFDKEEVKDTLFRKQNKLKLVTYCRSPENFQDYVIKEYLVYRIFNELSPMSFRARLAKISYQDGDRKPTVRHGFFIEHKKRLAKRLETEVLEPAERIPVSSLVADQATIVELFQFLVSNTDFSLIAPPEADTCCHNSVLFDGGDGTYIPVPYDFDRTGLVSPPNGLPDAHLGQRTFRDRVYRGFCGDEAVMNTALEKTRTARTAIEALISEQPGLSSRAKSQALKFVAGYYRIIDDDKRRARELKCRDVR
jgi:hypothetical protein